MTDCLNVSLHFVENNTVTPLLHPNTCLSQISLQSCLSQYQQDSFAFFRAPWLGFSSYKGFLFSMYGNCSLEGEADPLFCLSQAPNIYQLSTHPVPAWSCHQVHTVIQVGSGCLRILRGT